jgi:hypothetical protein
MDDGMVLQDVRHLRLLRWEDGDGFLQLQSLCVDPMKVYLEELKKQVETLGDDSPRQGFFITIAALGSIVLDLEHALDRFYDEFVQSAYKEGATMKSDSSMASKLMKEMRYRKSLTPEKRKLYELVAKKLQREFLAGRGEEAARRLLDGPQTS